MNYKVGQVYFNESENGWFLIRSESCGIYQGSSIYPHDHTTFNRCFLTVHRNVPELAGCVYVGECLSRVIEERIEAHRKSYGD